MTDATQQSIRTYQRVRFSVVIILFLTATLAALIPFGRTNYEFRLGVLLLLTAFIELLFGFRQVAKDGQRSIQLEGIISLFISFLLINSPHVAKAAFILLLAGWFGLEAVILLLQASGIRKHNKDNRFYSALKGLLWLLVAVGLLFIHGSVLIFSLAIIISLRILSAALLVYRSQYYSTEDSGSSVVQDMQLQEYPEVLQIANQMTEEEMLRAPIDRGWILGFILTLLAIHLGRMGLDRTYLGIIAPGFAVLGDVVIGLLLAFLVVLPCHLLLQKLTSGRVRHLWLWCLQSEAKQRGWIRRMVQSLLSYELRYSIRLKYSRYSLRTALRQGLQTGLPLAAIVAATVPVWGMSWYFDTENWAAGIWNSWAEERTDVWREAMVDAVLPTQKGQPADQVFAVHPLPQADQQDFAFIVIGDTGEGDASQHSLRAQYLDVVRRPDIQFVVISSDVVYPTGRMRDYENNFWLPFMGTTKPVYAIPGNHDWYDALEGFVATFFTPEAARLAMKARVIADNHVTSTSDQEIDRLIAEAERLKSHYRVPTQQQLAPFFQMQTASFALFAVDTGVLKRVDAAQMKWLQSALIAAKGKTKMVILGHPLYAGGRYQAEENDDFRAIHQLLKAHDVAVVMAGDTHDLEYYVERESNQPKPMVHFVNGGGGAYLSYGTSLDWPKEPATSTWAYFPSYAQTVAKIDATTPRWKWPAWWWVKQFKGWPFSAEWLSAAFDSNVAPFHQSFMEIRVEKSRNRMVLIPYGVNGRLRWQDLDYAKDAIPEGVKPTQEVEWIIQMSP